ncbi:MAG: aldo/keto reductase [Kiritimatiellae bacterium]|nr:aldo/keto reductase [Kiritimatiellia bacterium]
MLYNEFKGKKISALGMGGMRFPTIGEDYNNIDEAATQEMFDYAIDNGINYFDTAWGYHGGNSEAAVGRLLKKYPRESFYLASKFPGYDVNNMSRVKEIFEEQLKRCQVEYFDFYLFHNVCEANIDMYLDPKYGVCEYLLEQKKAGRIKHLGFSTHAQIENVKRFLDAYGSDMEFCQIQLNWLDWKLQDAKAKVELLQEINMPIFIMEPVRGGKLVNLDEEYVAQLNQVRPDISTVEWCFRYAQSFPSAVVTLSGMSNMDQLKDNLRIFSEDKPLNEEEKTKLLAIADNMMSKSSLPCTACRYCTSHCPLELDIPKLIDLYNESIFTEKSFLPGMYVNSLPEKKRPSACLGCKACEAVCPQNIKISEMMKHFDAILNKK